MFTRRALQLSAVLLPSLCAKNNTSSSLSLAGNIYAVFLPQQLLTRSITSQSYTYPSQPTPASTPTNTQGIQSTATVRETEQWANITDWHNPTNQRAYLDWLGNQFSFKEKADWYNVKMEDFSATKGGQALLKIYAHPSAALGKVYPDHNWEMWKFKCQTESWWTSVFHRKAYCRWLGGLLGVTQRTDWYRITTPQFISNYGEGLLKLYKWSVPAAVKGMHDWHEWHNWRFVDLPKDYWKKKTNQKEYMLWLGKHLNLKNTEDLYKIKASDLEENGGAGLLAEYKGSVPELVLNVYNNLKLDKSKFQ